MSQHAVDERHALAKTLRCADPDSPTLRGEWTVAQLLAHLVLRERSVVELGGRLPVRRRRQRAEHAVSALASGTPYDPPGDVDAVRAADRGL